MNSDFVREKTSQPAGLKPAEQAQTFCALCHGDQEARLHLLYPFAVDVDLEDVLITNGKSKHTLTHSALFL